MQSKKGRIVNHFQVLLSTKQTGKDNKMPLFVSTQTQSMYIKYVSSFPVISNVSRIKEQIARHENVQGLHPEEG